MKLAKYKAAAARMHRKLLGMLQVAAAYVVVYWIFRGDGSLKVDRSGIAGLKPPFIVLGNHTTFIDPALVQVAIARYPCYFLTTNFYFRHPVIGKILRLFGAIPKIQFSPDIRSMRGALTVLAQQDVLGIFPEGRRSIDGSCCEIPDAIARLIKKAKVPVVTVKIQGGYFVWPRWSSFWRSGRVEVVAEELLTTAAIDDMDTGQIYDAVCQALAYNEYDWNRQAKERYFHPQMAERLDLILHQCPRCQKEQSMRSKGNKLYCARCGNGAYLDEYGFLQPLDPACIVFPDPVTWCAWQREQMYKLVQDKAFVLQAAVKELRVADKFYGAFRSCGFGQVSISHAGMHFHGEIDGQAATLFFPIEQVLTISTEFMFDFEICDDKNAWWIFLEEEQQTVRIETAISLLHQLKILAEAKKPNLFLCSRLMS